MRTKKVHLLLLLITVCLCIDSYAQNKVIRGKITDSTGATIPNVSIRVKNAKPIAMGTTEGNFQVSVPPNTTLVFESLNFFPKEVNVGDQDSLLVTLSRNSESLTEVVVTALGVKRQKRDLTFSSQEVQGSELVRAKEPNIVNALSGKVAGVQITSSSGAPGSSSRIVIRGNTSVYGDNQALIVVDGVPINNDETGNLDAGPGTNRLADIDPSTIESINVLKGAAATALYGSSGARGVVMITTKRGNSNQKPVVNFTSDFSFEKPLLPELQNKYALGNRGEYYNGEDQKTSTSWGPLMDTLKIDGAPAKRYNLSDLFFKTGITRNNTISVSGGGSVSNYFMSYSYFDQDGTTPKTDYLRHTIFTKYTTHIAKNFTSTFQINLSSSKNNRMPEGYVLENPIWTVFAGPISWNPFPYLNPDGTQRVYRYSRNNPWWVLDNVYNKSTVNRAIPLLTFTYSPFGWLNITERVGADVYSEQDKYREAPSSTLATTGVIAERNTNFRQFNHDFIINANKQFGDFNAELLLGNNVFSSYSQYYNQRGVGLTINDFDNISSASTITGAETHFLQRKVGFYAQANIEYKRFLILSLTGRYDQSSVLAILNNTYPYGSVATSFIFSDLLPASAQKVFSFGKIRLSAATVGNDGVGPYSLQTPYLSQNSNNTRFGNIYFPFNGQAGFLLSQTLGNPNLKNERLNEYEVGLETKFFQNRIGLEASYFYKKTIDGLIPGVAIAPSSGYTGTTVNTASLENKGVEILLTATPVVSKNFRWDLTFNFSQIRNKVLALAPGTTQLGNGFTQLIVGQPYGVKYGARMLRDSATGELMIDENGQPIRDPQDGIVGNISPDWLAGITNTLRYKQLSLSFLFDMKKGGDIENNVDGYGTFYGVTKSSENREPFVIKGISTVTGKENTVAADAQTYYQSFGGLLENVIQDGTYLKLRNVSLSYELNPGLLKNAFVKSASLTITGRNLWIYSPHFTGADPEVSSFGSSSGSQGIYSFSTPTSRSVAFTLRVGF